MALCRVCQQVKPVDEFYPQQLRKCGTLGECKDCTKERVRRNRAANADYFRAYDRKRYREQPQRKEAARKSAASPAGIRSKQRSTERSRRNNPEKWRARNMVSNAIRDGKLERGEECFFCGSDANLQAHHEDYSHPIDVVWLCPSCHGKLHTIKGDFRRAG